MSDVRLEWRAHDGSRWDWLSGENGVLAGRGLSGLLFPQFDQLMSDTQAGGRWQGLRPRPRKITVKLQVGDNISSLNPEPFSAPDDFFPNRGASIARDSYRRGARWRELDRAVRASLLPTRVGTLACITPEGERTINLIVDSVTDTVSMWPDIRGFQEYDVDFTSESAYWSGGEIRFTVGLAQSSGVDYYGGRGPDFTLSQGVQLQGQPVQNPGDVEAWPVWELTGPGQFSVGVGATQTVTKALTDGEKLVIDTAARTVLNTSGVSAWGRLQSRGFAPIPAGMSSDVVVTAVDATSRSSAVMTFRPQFMGAY